MGRTKSVLDYLFNFKEITVGSFDKEEKNVEEEIKDLIKEKRLTEGNLYFLDSLQGLTMVLYFSILNSSADSFNTFLELTDQTMHYLLYYSRQIKPTNLNVDILGNIEKNANQLQAVIDEFKNKPASSKPDTYKWCLRVYRVF